MYSFLLNGHGSKIIRLHVAKKLMLIFLSLQFSRGTTPNRLDRYPISTSSFFSLYKKEGKTKKDSMVNTSLIYMLCHDLLRISLPMAR
jgi:hypothetical protein